MKVTFEALPSTVIRTIKVTPPGSRVEGKLDLTFSRLTMQDAADEVILHDKALASVDEDGNEIKSEDVYAGRTTWLQEFLEKNLQDWSLENGDSGENYPVDAEMIAKYLSLDNFYWPTYRDVLDYLTKMANGKSKSELELEVKNLLNLDKKTTGKARG